MAERIGVYVYSTDSGVQWSEVEGRNFRVYLGTEQNGEPQFIDIRLRPNHETGEGLIMELRSMPSGILVEPRSSNTIQVGVSKT